MLERVLCKFNHVLCAPLDSVMHRFRLYTEEEILTTLNVSKLSTSISSISWYKICNSLQYMRNYSQYHIILCKLTLFGMFMWRAMREGKKLSLKRGLKLNWILQKSRAFDRKSRREVMLYNFLQVFMVAETKKNKRKKNRYRISSIIKQIAIKMIYVTFEDEERSEM